MTAWASAQRTITNPATTPPGVRRYRPTGTPHTSAVSSTTVCAPSKTPIAANSSLKLANAGGIGPMTASARHASASTSGHVMNPSSQNRHRTGSFAAGRSGGGTPANWSANDVANGSATSAGVPSAATSHRIRLTRHATHPTNAVMHATKYQTAHTNQLAVGAAGIQAGRGVKFSSTIPPTVSRTDPAATAACRFHRPTAARRRRTSHTRTPAHATPQTLMSPPIHPNKTFTRNGVGVAQSNTSSGATPAGGMTTIGAANTAARTPSSVRRPAPGRRAAHTASAAVASETAAAAARKNVPSR